MEERLIDAVVIKSGEKVRVRQTEAGSEYFVTEDNSPYHSKELDFTQQDIVDKLTQDLQDQMGRPVPVVVVEKDEEFITLDANHEMAGKELNFTIELVEVLD